MVESSPMTKTLADRVLRARTALEMSQEELGLRLGLTRQGVCAIEKGGGTSKAVDILLGQMEDLLTRRRKARERRASR